MFAEESQWQVGGGDTPTCESCGREVASVHILRLEGAELTRVHVCQSCAEDLVDQTEGTALVFAVPNLLSGLLSRAAKAETDVEKQPGEPTKMCVVCGTTLSDVLETGMLGCAACYEVFAPQLERGLGAGGSSHSHLGKIPGRVAAGDPTQREVLRLRRMLKELVDSERYEEAASVRDRLAELAQHPVEEV